MNRRRISILLLIVLILSAFIPLTLYEAPVVEATLTEVGKITITNNGATNITDTAIKVTITNPNFFSNVDETHLRIQDSNGNDIPFWIEKWDSSNQEAIIWVKVTVSAGASIDLYCYYDDTLTSTLSNGESVFLFFDDFEGTELDTNKWDKVGNGTIQIANSEIIIDISSYSTSIYSKATFGVNTILEVKWRASSVDLDYPGFGYGNRGSTDIVDDAGTGHGICVGKLHAANNYVQGRQTNDGQHVAETGDLGVDHSTYHIYQIRRYPDHSEFYVDGVFKASLFDYYPTEDLYIGIGGHTSGETGQSIADWIRVRKYYDESSVSVSYTDLGLNLVGVISITNHGTSDLMDRVFRVEITSSEFFSRLDKTHLRIKDENSNDVSFWIETWDTSRHVAVIWVKTSVLAGETKNLYVYSDPLLSQSLSDYTIFEYVDTFDDNDISEYIEQTLTGDATWSVSNGIVSAQITSTGDEYLLAPSQYTITNFVMITKTRMLETTLENEQPGLIACYIDNDNRYSARLDDNFQRLHVGGVIGGNGFDVIEVSYDFSDGVWYNFVWIRLD